MKQTALITGASGGIGYELACVHASKGGDLILTARSAEKLEAVKIELESRYGSEVHLICNDLSETDSAYEILDYVNSRNLQVDYLINNAGFGVFGKFSETEWATELRMINLNITAPALLTKLFLHEMIQRGSGRIMNVASTASFQPGPLMSVYYASKAFLLSFSEAVGNEARDSGVTITALCPGPTRTGFQDAAGINESRLVKGRKLPTSREVAEFGYDAMLKGKTVAIPGMMNKGMIFAERFIPRSWTVRIARYVQNKR